MLEVKQEMNFDDLKNNCWSGAVDTLEAIEKAGLEDVFMDYLEQIFCEETPTMTEVNDVIWFDGYINNDFINENKTLDDVDSLEELKEYASNSDVYSVLDNTSYKEDLWQYLQDNYAGETLSTVFDELTSLEPNDYISFDSIKSLSEFIELTKDNDTVMEVIDAIKEANLTDEYWNRLEEECKGIGYTITNVVDDIESLDIDELIESL
jgi:hypothetical protein